MSGIHLDVRTAATTIQQALVDTIHLGLGWRRPAAADLVALEADDVASVPDRALRLVTSEGVAYRWHNASRLGHRSPYVIAPLSRPNNGRWIRQSTRVTLGPNYYKPLHRVTTGYAKAVQLFQGESGEELDRIFGQKPAFLVEWTGDDLVTKSAQAGTIYQANYEFAIHVISQNLRQGAEAVQGSPIAGEDVADPGLNRMIGDLRYLLAGCRLDLEPGVKYVDIQGKARVRRADLAQRAMYGTVPLIVRASCNIPDEDLITPDEIWIQGMDCDTPPGEEFDLSNFVREGYTLWPTSGLVATSDPGVATVQGQIVSTAPGPHLFTANKDTYRDLRKSGELLYSEVAIDDPAPAQEAGTLRIGVTRTSSSDVISDVLLCSYAIARGAPQRISTR